MILESDTNEKAKKEIHYSGVVFILGMCALIGAIYVVGKSQEQQNRTNAKLNAMTYTERIYGELMEGIGVTDTLKQVVISGDGNINKFYDIDSLNKTSIADFKKIDGIGDVMANQLYDYFQDLDNMEEILLFEKMGWKTSTEKPEETSNVFEGYLL